MAAELRQVREIGKKAGEAITQAGEPVTVQLVHNDYYLAVLIVRYDIWARAPLLVRGIFGTWAGDGLPARFMAVRHHSPHVLALEEQQSRSLRRPRQRGQSSS